MQISKFKSHILAATTGFVLLATFILLVLQWGNSARFSLFGKSYAPGKDGSGGVNTGLIMICCLIAGPILLWLGKICVKHSMLIHRERKAVKKAQIKEELLTEQIITKVGQGSTATGAGSE